MSRQPAASHSLESLKKEAKRWIKALRAHNPEALARLRKTYPDAPASPVLRHIQHALAVEHDFPDWNTLAEFLESNGSEVLPALQQYEEMAEALLVAYRTGTSEALERHYRFTWHRRAWSAMRTYVQLDLGRHVGDDNQEDVITLDDARLLVAKEHGFESWEALGEYVATLPAIAGEVAAKPVRLFSTEDTGEKRTVLQGLEWETVIETMQERQFSGLDAQGQMTDALLDRISRIELVTSLDLNGSKALTDRGLRCLQRMPQLLHLKLNGTEITDGGLEVLRTLPNLRSIDLSWTNISDAGASQLASCKFLERVNLMRTFAGDGAIKALSGKPNLCHFWSGSALTDAGMSLFHEFPAFKTWQGGEARMALLDFDADPNYLGLTGSFTNDGLSSLSGLDGLFALNIGERGLAISAPGLAPLATLPNLGWLSFDADDEAMPIIAAMSKLRFLMCQDTVASDEGFVALSRSQSIEKIWGRRCWNLRTRGFAALSKMPALRSLSVSCKNVEDAGLSTLPSFPALQELMPMDVPNKGYRHIGQCIRMESLILMYCRETGDAATEHLVGLPNLRKYFASYNRITDRTPELLSGISSLEEIEFSACAGLTNRGVAALAKLPRLRELRAEGMQNVTSAIAALFPPSVRVEHSV